MTKKLKPTSKSVLKSREANEILEHVKDCIKLSRLKILEITDKYYLAKFDYRNYEFSESKKSHTNPDNLYLYGKGAIHVKVPEGLLWDEEIPKDFMEVVLFHELREQEYIRAEDIHDIHERAVHDEILYVLKFLPPKMQKEYFKFSKKYRERKRQILSGEQRES